MIFFVGNDGTVISSVPSPVYQGSAGANDMYVVAPFAANLSATVAFKLPNGVYTEQYLMTPTGEITGVINQVTGKPYSGWQFSIPNEITEYFGSVTAQFYFYSAQAGRILASSSTSFLVAKGVPAVFPRTPTPDVYQNILSNLALLQQQLNNGTYAARAIYAWNSEYTYGANELIFYPNKGTYGTFLKSLVGNNNTLPYDTDGALNLTDWEEITDFNVINELYSLKTDVEQAVLSVNTSASAAAQSANTATNQANAAEQSASNAENAAQRVESAASYLEGVQSGETAVPKAVNDDNGVNIADHFEKIESYIPSGTSEENQLANKDFVNSSINNMAAFYITSNEQGEAFPTRADLLSATTFYSGGQERVPTQNDYAIVLADESQPVGVDGNHPTTRYSYQGGTYPEGQWDFQYVVNNTSLTQAQVDAINSGITKELVDTIGKGNVMSVNGETGAVTITPASIGALTLTGLVDLLYPVGGGERFVQFPNAQTPAQKFPGTSWEIDTTYQGRTLIGSGGNYTFGATGGSADAVIVEHGLHLYADGEWNAHGSAIGKYLPHDSLWEYGNLGRGWNEAYGGEVYPAGQTIGESGVGKNMPPYIVVNCWKRTA